MFEFLKISFVKISIKFPKNKRENYGETIIVDNIPENFGKVFLKF